MTRSIRFALVAAALSAAALGPAGCTNSFIDNLTEERSGNITVVFINATDARAILSFGTFDALDRNPPGAVTLQQTRVEARSTSATFTLPCRRNMAIATQDLLDRVLITNADDVDGFDPDAFNEGVFFSSAPSGSDAEALPTAGTALAREVRLGVDYKCGDQLFFTFVADDTKAGGFDIQYSLLPSVETDE